MLTTISPSLDMAIPTLVLEVAMELMILILKKSGLFQAAVMDVLNLSRYADRKASSLVHWAV